MAANNNQNNNANNNNKRTLVYMDQVNPTLFEFDTDTELHAWNREVHEIKDEIEAINNACIAGTTTQDQQKPNYIAWVQRVKRFVNSFGEKHVPNDIKYALNDTERGVGLQVTQWQHPFDPTRYANYY